MKEFIDAANYNLGRGGNLTTVCAKGIALAQQRGKEKEVVSYLQELPPAKSFNNPSSGLDELIAGLSNLQITQTVEQSRTR